MIEWTSLVPQRLWIRQSAGVDLDTEVKALLRNQITQRNGKQSIASMLAIDLAKDVFELSFADNSGRIIARKRLKRKPFSEYLHEHAPQRGVHASG